jgi:hypothetical protein
MSLCNNACNKFEQPLLQAAMWNHAGVGKGWQGVLRVGTLRRMINFITIDDDNSTSTSMQCHAWRGLHRGCHEVTGELQDPGQIRDWEGPLLPRSRGKRCLKLLGCFGSCMGVEFWWGLWLRGCIIS